MKYEGSGKSEYDTEWMSKVFTTGLIFFFASVIIGVVGGVCVCAYFYKEGKRKSQIRPADEPVAKMVEPFDTKKLWERGKRKPVTLTNASNSRTESESGINPSVIDDGEPPPPPPQPVASAPVEIV